MSDETLTIVVEDSGTGPSAEPSEGKPAGAGIGMANVARRLQLCFGTSAHIELQHGAFGTRVQVSVPVSQAPQRLAASPPRAPA